MDHMVPTDREADNLQILITAANGRELLDKIAACNELPEICILDIRMPVLDGHDTWFELQKNYPAIKSLILTGFGDDMRLLKMLRAGAGGWLPRNTAPATLVQALREIYTYGFCHSCVNLRSEVKRSPYEVMLPQEERFLTHCAQPLTYKEIGLLMNLGERTVQHLAEKVSEKLGIRNNRVAFAIYAMQAGFGTADYVE